MKKYALVLPVLLIALFLAFSPTKASAGNFPVAVSGGDITIKEGETITRTVVVGNPDGYTGDITIHASRADMPPGVNITFNPDTGIISTGMSFQTTATFKADGLVLAGSYKYIIGVTPPGRNLEWGTATKLNMTTLNKVNPAKAMPSTVNTIRASATKMTGLRLELPDPNPGDSFTALVGNGVFSVKSWTNPVLIMDKNYGLGTIGTRWFSLADPLNPQEDVSKRVGIPYFYCGDPGGQHYANSLSYSRDGQYLAGNIYNCGSIVSIPGHNLNDGVYATGADPSFYRFIRPDNLESNPIDIFESKTQSNSHVYYTSFDRGGVVRLDGITSSGASLEEMQTGSKTSFIYPELPATAPNIPKTSASGGVRTIVMAGATDHVAVLTGPGNTMSITPNKLSVYIPTENNPVAEITVNNVPANAGGVANLTSFVTSDVQYVMFTVSLPWINASQVSTSQLSILNPKRSSNLLYVYKFDPATNTLTKVVEGIKIVGVIGTGLTQQNIAGIRVGNKDGVMVLLNDDITTNNWMKPVIYMFSDLSAGNLKNVFVDATYSVAGNIYQNGGGAKSLIASLNKGDTTYVYLNTQGTCEGVNMGTITSCTGIAVLKFDPSGVNVGETPPPPPSVAICQDSTSLNYGGTLPCRYPPRPRPACSPGDLFDTVTGLPCGSATGTGRKLSCVNLSSNFYCSYTSDTPVTAVPPTPPPPVLPPNSPPPNPSPAVTSCSLKSAPFVFMPSPPGAARPQTLSTGFNTWLALYQEGVGGGHRLVVSEAYGYSILDLANPANPVALMYHDERFPWLGPNSVNHGGDGQSNVQGMDVSPDGQRLVLGMSGPTGFNTIVGNRSGGGHGFTFWGDFDPQGSFGVALQQIGNRYIAYNIQDVVRAIDVTTLPGSFGMRNMVDTQETTTWTLGGDLRMVGNILIYSGMDGLNVRDASNPGPIGSITTAVPYPVTVITQSDIGPPPPPYKHYGEIADYSAAIDPQDATKLWMLLEVNGLASENSPSYRLMYITGLGSGTLTKHFVSPTWRVPSVAGEQWVGGGGSAIVPVNGNLFALMWANRTGTGNNYMYRLYSTQLSSWGNINTSAPPGHFEITPVSSPDFALGRQASFSIGTSVYMYVLSSRSHVISLSCGTSTTPVIPLPPPPTPPPTPPPALYSCPTGASLGLPACNNGCYVAQPGPSGRALADIWKCVPNGSFTQLLKLGSSGSEVVALQKFLNAAGYDSGTADGSFGPKTQAAVIKFQIANGLVGDGIVGPATRAILNKGNVSATPACTLNISYNPTTVPYNGSLTVAYSGTNVNNSTVQYNFDNKGYAPLSPFPDSKVQSNLTSVGTHNIILQGKNSAGATCYSNTPSYTVSPATTPPADLQTNELKVIDNLIKIYGSADTTDYINYLKTSSATPNSVVPLISLGQAYLNRYENYGKKLSDFSKAMDYFEIVTTPSIYSNWSGGQAASSPTLAYLLMGVYRAKTDAVSDSGLVARANNLFTQGEGFVETVASVLINNNNLPRKPYVSGTSADGDTKAEENAWDAMFFAWASQLYPSNSHSALWNTTAKMLAGYSIVTRDEGATFNSQPLSTVENDFTLTNHWVKGNCYYEGGTVELLRLGALAYSLTGNQVPAEFQHNVSGLYGKYKSTCMTESAGRFSSWTLGVNTDPAGDPTIFPLAGLGDNAFEQQMVSQKAADDYLWKNVTPAPTKIVMDGENLSGDISSSFGAMIQNAKVVWYYIGGSYLWHKF